MTKHMTTHAPIQDGGIISQWTIISGGPSSPVVRTGPTRPAKGEPKPLPERNVLVTLRQLLQADKETGRREVIEARAVLTPAILRGLIDQLEDHASNVETVTAVTLDGKTHGGTVPEGIHIHVDPQSGYGAAASPELARAVAERNLSRLRLNGGAL